MSDLLEVARLGRTVGLKGALKLHNTSDFPSQFKKGATFFLKDGTNLRISHFNAANSSVIFEGYESVEAATNLVNLTLFQTKEVTQKTCKLKKGEFFYFDVIGLEIYENGELLGAVEDIMESSGGYLFLVKTAAGLAQNGLAKEFYLPYNDRFVEEISLQKRQISAKFAKGILENS